MVTLRRITLPVLLIAAVCHAIAQTKPAQTKPAQANPAPPPKITLEQAGSRTGRDRVPAYEGKEVLVTGQISTRPIWIADSYYVPIQDDASFGLLLRPDLTQLPGLAPGDWVEAQGIVSKRAGLPILVPHTLRRLRHTTAPAPKVVTLARPGVFSLHGRAGHPRKHRYRRGQEWRRGSAPDRPAQQRAERVPAPHAARRRP